MFLADRPDASGLAGFDIPLVYISNDKLNQPVGAGRGRGGLGASADRAVAGARMHACTAAEACGPRSPAETLAPPRRPPPKPQIFGCNNLSGRVWPATEGGGPAGGLPPHEWRVNFKSGGIGTVWPMYYALVARARRAEAAVKQPAEVVEEITKMAQTAFVGGRGGAGGGGVQGAGGGAGGGGRGRAGARGRGEGGRGMAGHGMAWFCSPSPR